MTPDRRKEERRKADSSLCSLYRRKEHRRAPGQIKLLHQATANLVRRFAIALSDKLLAAEKKYGYSDGWQSKDWMDECRAKLREHIEKGDPRDVAAYCAFLWHHGESTTERTQPSSAVEQGEPE